MGAGNIWMYGGITGSMMGWMYLRREIIQSIGGGKFISLFSHGIPESRAGLRTFICTTFLTDRFENVNRGNSASLSRSQLRDD